MLSMSTTLQNISHKLHSLSTLQVIIPIALPLPSDPPKRNSSTNIEKAWVRGGWEAVRPWGAAGP